MLSDDKNHIEVNPLRPSWDLNECFSVLSREALWHFPRGPKACCQCSGYFFVYEKIMFSKTKYCRRLHIQMIKYSMARCPLGDLVQWLPKVEMSYSVTEASFICLFMCGPFKASSLHHRLGNMMTDRK